MQREGRPGSWQGDRVSGSRWLSVGPRRGRLRVEAGKAQTICTTAFSDAPDGLPGNDDCGTISGWFVLSALGMYPDCPGDPLFTVSDPLFTRARLHLRGKAGRVSQLAIERSGDRARPVGSVRLNQNSYPGFRVPHADLVEGGKLVLEP